jgi:hypothetical protein
MRYYGRDDKNMVLVEMSASGIDARIRNRP